MTVAGAPVDAGAESDGGEDATSPVSDSGSGDDGGLPVVDSGTPVADAGRPSATDAGEADAGSGSSGKSGCSCGVAGDAREPHAGALAGLLLGLVAVGRRRRS